ncbi:hypothetical protein IRZ71_05700 [Flavobacterium sp. ANB]|uniref:hypothetical protein n=1 Tax=unclassified Flavobacterium TaxID=196869 RepID=UPI0012BA26B6|nr:MULTISPECIES: hypothetical protein [unclassified Flavobacterium]MBF4515825.1 hypothetical protein [Flavobacterium sp. ANB]MTD68828.1 hypothetical protein [Flavobacterium sp. LC2016-13]
MQKTTTLILIILFSLFISCKEKNNKVGNIPLKNVADDTKQIEAKITDNTIYPVYNLANNTTAIVVEIFDSGKNAEYEKIYTRINETDSLENDFYKHASLNVRKFEYYDTLGIVQLIKSKELEKEIKKIIEPKYYVYGTKGFSEVTVDEVVCRIDDCRENFIGLTFKNFDTAKNGKPILCSIKPLQLNYGKNYFAVQNKIQKMDDSLVYRYSDTDPTRVKVFANIGPAYFAYNDDFLWGKNSKLSKCKFPERRVLVQQKNNKFNTILLGGLDLYGLSCD